jgi:hypothetical protein
MTRYGVIAFLYYEPRPFSRFTRVPSEIKANKQWWKRALEWGELNIDKYGNRIK